MNIGQLLVNAARRHGDRPAVTHGCASLTYEELDRRSAAIAMGLGELGLRRGERVAVLMRNRPELLETMFACFRSGLCLVPLNARFTSEEVQYHLADCTAAAIVTDAPGAELAAEGGVDARVIVVGDDPAGEVGYEDLIASHQRDTVTAATPVERDELAWLFYTSGTTGRPKGAMLTHGVLAYALASYLADLVPMDERDVALHVAPLTHGAGFHAIAAVARAAHQVISADGPFAPSDVLELMATERVTNAWMVPTQIVMLCDTLGDSAADLPDLRRLVYGGAPFAVPELRRALAAFGPVLVQLFGQGETPMTATYLSPDEHLSALEGDHPERLGSAGICRPGMDVRVLDADDRELPTGEVGEVCVRGPAVMLGYWERPEATADTLRNGWLHTGDLGRIDDHGFLYLLDRSKDLIISGGSNVYAAEVEAVLSEHPAVREVAVVGVPDRTWGEQVVAVVVPAGGADAGVVAALEVSAERLAPYKRPRRYELVDALPRNSYGKVLKRQLRERLAAQDADVAIDEGVVPA